MPAKLSASDIKGMWVILATPAKENASDWRAENTVDLAETARVVEALIDAGVDGLLSLGTFGEGATLTWEEKRAFMGTVVETVRGRVPYFAGTTSLNTRETVRQTRAASDLGGDVRTFAARPGLGHHDVQRQVADHAEGGHHGFRLA